MAKHSALRMCSFAVLLIFNDVCITSQHRVHVPKTQHILGHPPHPPPSPESPSGRRKPKEGDREGRSYEYMALDSHANMVSETYCPPAPPPSPRFSVFGFLGMMVSIAATTANILNSINNNNNNNNNDNNNNNNDLSGNNGGGGGEEAANDEAPTATSVPVRINQVSQQNAQGDLGPDGVPVLAAPPPDIPSDPSSISFSGRVATHRHYKTPRSTRKTRAKTNRQEPRGSGTRPHTLDVCPCRKGKKTRKTRDNESEEPSHVRSKRNQPPPSDEDKAWHGYLKETTDSASVASGLKEHPDGGDTAFQGSIETSRRDETGQRGGGDGWQLKAWQCVLRLACEMDVIEHTFVRVPVWAVGGRLTGVPLVGSSPELSCDTLRCPPLQRAR